MDIGGGYNIYIYIALCGIYNWLVGTLTDSQGYNQSTNHLGVDTHMKLANGA